MTFGTTLVQRSLTQMKFVFREYYFRNSIINVVFIGDAEELTSINIPLSGPCNEWAD